MLNWLRSLLPNRGARPDVIPEALWRRTLAHYPFLARRSAADLMRLRSLVGEFLAHKEFSGAHGLVVTDAMAVAIAAQACLPVLQLGLRWYDDFKGIVVHPGAMLARRKVTDHAGVVHHYSEALLGEAMERGPVTLSWQDVAAAGESAEHGHNVVIHEFIHKIDMRDGAADGCPPLPSRAARAAWHAVMQPAYDSFCEQVAMAHRFGAEPPWLDAYGATAPAEFFAVACEAYFVNRERFTQDFAPLTALFDQFFKINTPSAQ
ncbi:zinc-dependent peptidase [Polaromonas jejuensis]|uniref:Zinc-dependent peptidase n=1 Tax=Polaromonas jejuensis TaxID=457502 RepID=A0ABW0QG84_9BURK|nr:M90 family metallopeptidase [Polaromonas jejuensis]